jgi:hypothetical protein
LSPERTPRLGEVIEDYCPRCRLLLNHDVASILGDSVSKVTCRTCFNTHDYRQGRQPARRKPKAQQTQSLMDQVLSSLPVPPAADSPPAPPPARKKRDLWADVERLNQRKKE